MSNTYVDILNGMTGKIQSISLCQLAEFVGKNIPSTPNKEDEGITLSNVANYTVNGGVTIIDDTNLLASNININIGSGLADGQAIVDVIANNKKISLFNKTGMRMQYYVSITQSITQSNLNYGKTFSAIASNGDLILTMPQVQMNGLTIDIRTGITNTNILNAHIAINITPMISPAYNSNTILGTEGTSGYVNIDSTYEGRSVIIDNENFNDITSIAIDKSVVTYNSTRLNVTVKAGLQPVLVTNNTSYPASYSIVVTSNSITSLYEGNIVSGQYIPGMTQDRPIEGEYIDISIQPVFSTQIDPNSILGIVGIQIMGQVIILDAVTKSNVIPPNIRTAPIIEYTIDSNAIFSSSTIDGSNGTFLLDVTDIGQVVPFSIFTTSNIRTLGVENNSTTNVDVRYYNNDTILANTFDSDYPNVRSDTYYVDLYNNIVGSNPTQEGLVTPGSIFIIPDTGIIPAQTYISAVYYPPGYSGNPTATLAIFTSSDPNDATYITYNIAPSQGGLEIENNTGYINNFVNTQLITLNDPSSAYTLIVDPSIVQPSASQTVPIDGIVGVYGVVGASTLSLKNGTSIPTIALVETVSGTSSSPTVNSIGYQYIAPGASIPITIPNGGGTTYFSFSLINARSNFIVIYASVANQSMYDPNNIVSSHTSIDADNAGISTTILSPIAVTAPVVSLIPSTLLENKPITIYVNNLNSTVILENQTGQSLTINISGNSGTIANGQTLPFPVLFGVFSLSVSGSTVTIKPATVVGSGGIVGNQTLYLSDGAFVPSAAQLGGYINLQYGSATIGAFVIPPGINNYSPFYLLNTQQQDLILTNNIGVPLTLSLAIYTVSNKVSVINAVIPVKGTYNLGKPVEVEVYYANDTLVGIVVL